jgi:hypothetical protein
MRVCCVCRRRRAGHAHYQAEIRDQAVVDTHHAGAQCVAARRLVPSLKPRQRAAVERLRLAREIAENFGVRTLVARQPGRRRVRLPVVLAAGGAFDAGNGRQHHPRPKSSRQEPQHAGAEGQRRLRRRNPGLPEHPLPERHMLLLGRRQLAVERRQRRVFLALRQQKIKCRRVALRREVLFETLDVRPFGHFR